MYDPFDPWGGEFSRLLEQMRQFDLIGRPSLLQQAGAAAEVVRAASEVSKHLQINDTVKDLASQAISYHAALDSQLSVQKLIDDSVAANAATLPQNAASAAIEAIRPWIDGQAMLAASAASMDLKNLIPAQASAYHAALDAWKTQLSMQRQIDDSVAAVVAKAALPLLVNPQGIQGAPSIAIDVNRWLAEHATLAASFASVDWLAIDLSMGPILEARSTTAELVRAYFELGVSSIGSTGALFNILPETDFLAHLSLLRGLGRPESGPRKERSAPRPHESDELVQADPSDGRQDFARRSSDSLEQLLSQRMPKLLPLWRGAREAARSRGSDWIRQYCTSQRELLRWATQLGAPDPEVRKWTSKKNHFVNERPTRRARIEFLCERAAVKGLAEFVVLDVEAAIATFALLQQGVHEIPSTLLPTQVADLTIRGDNLLLLVALLATEQVN